MSSIKVQGNGYLIWTNVWRDIGNRFSAILPYIKDDRRYYKKWWNSFTNKA